MTHQSSVGSGSEDSGSYSSDGDSGTLVSRTSLTQTGNAVSRRHWQSSKDSKLCGNCASVFNLLRRKHHCRNCGGVFCRGCTRERLQLDGAQGRIDGRIGAAPRGSRVCVSCAAKYEQDRAHPVYRLLGNALAERYFYRLVRNGDTCADTLRSLSPQSMTNLMVRNEVRKSDVRTFARALKGHADPMDSILSPQKGTSSEDNGPSRQALRDRSVARSLNFGSSSKSEQGHRRHAMSEEIESLDFRLKEMHANLERMKAKRAEEEQKFGTLRALQMELSAERRRRVRRERAKQDRETRGTDAHKLERGRRLGRRRSFTRAAHHSLTCQLCGTPHSSFRREHHCRQCFKSVCASCSTARGPGGQRRCDWCHVEHTLSSEGWVNRVAGSGQDRAYWIQVCEEQLNMLLTMDGSCSPAASPSPRSMLSGNSVAGLEVASPEKFGSICAGSLRLQTSGPMARTLPEFTACANEVPSRRRE